MDKIEEILTRGVENIIPNREALEKVLRSGKKLNIYNGIDPTATRIHIGHLFPLRKLQSLVELGHNVTFLIGDFTALIGDTSDKDAERPILTYKQIEKNFADYKRQAEKVLDFSKVRTVHNSDWLRKLTFEEIVQLCRHFSANDFLSRELIRKRLDEGKTVRLDEVLYPVMQGYDSYFMDMDLQIGGTDQTFNMQAGRTLQKNLRGKESFVMATGFLTGTDGRKMSKSWGNAIWVDDGPDDMYGKVMSTKDDLIAEYFTLGTGISMDEVAKVESRLKSDENPMNLKKELAHQIVLELHGKEAADNAQKYFEETFQEGKVPKGIQTISAGKPEISAQELSELLAKEGVIKSKSEGRRLIVQGGISDTSRKVVVGMESMISLPTVLQIGKRTFVKVTGS